MLIIKLMRLSRGVKTSALVHHQQPEQVLG
jgi:hypothetical protein